MLGKSTKKMQINDAAFLMADNCANEYSSVELTRLVERKLKDAL